MGYCMEENRIPITMISGPLGAGKTTLVNHLLENPGERSIAVLVNDMGEINIDAELLDGETEQGVVDLSNGCICCRLQDDLVTEVSRLAERRTFDYLVVEASGISEPIPIAQALTVGTDAGELPDQFYLDTTVSVVDAYGFWKAFDSDESLPDSAPDPQRPLTEVMIDQIEFCDVLLLNKCDMVPDDALDIIEAEIRQLQPRATVHRTEYSEVTPETVLSTNKFDFDDAQQQQGWKQALKSDDHTHSAAEKHGVASFVYRRQQPFEPDQLDAWLDEWNGNIVRAKGFAWVRSRPDTVLGISQAGPAVKAGPIGEWGQDDPATQLVFIGTDLDEQRLSEELDQCIASEQEPAQSPESDPFPRG